MDIQEAVKAVRQFAREHYNQDGWDYVVESLDRLELEAIIVDSKAETVEEAIEAVGARCSFWDDRRKDIQAEIF